MSGRGNLWRESSMAITLASGCPIQMGILRSPAASLRITTGDWFFWSTARVSITTSTNTRPLTPCGRRLQRAGDLLSSSTIMRADGAISCSG